MATSLTIDNPPQYKVFQRDVSESADIAIDGTYTGPDSAGIEARWAGGDWALVDSLVTGGGNFSCVLSGQSVGQGALEIRDIDSPGVTDSVADIGIGDVFLCIGQSNAAGELENFQTYTGSLIASMYDYTNEVWGELADPTGANVLQGSVWPLLATLIMADQGVPVAFISSAVGSTSLVSGVAHWAPPSGARYTDTLARYAAAAPGGLKAILCYLGESDAIAATTQAAYQTAFSAMLDAFQTDLGLPSVQMVAACIGSAFAEPDANVDAIRLATINRWDNDADILAGPVAHDQDFADGIHWFSDAQAQILADRWWRSLRAHFYGGALEPARGPTFVSADRTGTTVTVIFTDGVLPLQGQANALGWTYTDGGSPVTVSAAAAYSTNGVNLTLGGTPVGVELLYWCSGDNGAGGQLRDSGPLAEIPPEPVIGASVTTHGTGTSSGRGWFR